MNLNLIFTEGRKLKGDGLLYGCAVLFNRCQSPIFFVMAELFEIFVN